MPRIRKNNHSASPFYDHDFVASHGLVRGPRPNKYKYRKKAAPVPIAARAVEKWTCDRCGFSAEFPDSVGATATEVGWLELNLTHSLSKQVLCPVCAGELAVWFTKEKAT